MNSRGNNNNDADQHENETNGDVVCGTCTEMCSESEIVEREKLFIIHRLESSLDINDPLIERQRSRKMDRRKMVKSYSRPAAGKDTMRAECLRPYLVLLKTTKYLLGLLNDNRLDFAQVYDFLFDRLRAVRQDMIVQRISAENTIVLLETMLTFYFYSFYNYQSSERKISTFDLGLHEIQTKEIISRLHDAYCYRNEFEKNSTVSTNFLCSIWLYNYSDTNFNLHFYSTWHKFGLDKIERCIFAMENGNFIRFFRSFRRFGDAKLQLAAVKFVPPIRYRAFLILAKAYGSRQSDFPLQILREWLDFASLEDLKSCCSDMNLHIIEESVRFAPNANDLTAAKEFLQKPHWFRCNSLLSLDVSVCTKF